MPLCGYQASLTLRQGVLQDDRDRVPVEDGVRLGRAPAGVLAEKPDRSRRDLSRELAAAHLRAVVLDIAHGRHLSLPLGRSRGRGRENDQNPPNGLFRVAPNGSAVGIGGRAGYVGLVVIAQTATR